MTPADTPQEDFEHNLTNLNDDWLSTTHRELIEDGYIEVK